MKHICNTCGKHFTSKHTDKKLLLTKAYCSEFCWFNNNEPHE